MSVTCDPVDPPNIIWISECVEGALWKVRVQEYLCTDENGNTFTMWRELERANTGDPC